MQNISNIKAIEDAIEQYGEVVVRKNNNNNVIIMSMDEYKKKSLDRDIVRKLKRSEEEIENGEGINSDVVFKELREEYGY